MTANERRRGTLAVAVLSGPKFVTISVRHIQINVFFVSCPMMWASDPLYSGSSPSDNALRSPRRRHRRGRST